MYLLQASTCRILCLRTTICGQYWFFVITWRKLLQNRIECLSKLTVNMLLAKHSVSSGLKNSSGHFDVRNEDRWKPPKKFVWWDQKGVIYYELLKPGETVNTNRYQQQMIDLNRALQERRPDYRRRQHKVIFFTIMPHHTQRIGSRKRSRWSVGKYWRIPLILQTWLRWITICSHHWPTLSLNNASLRTKMYENGWITGLI